MMINYILDAFFLLAMVLRLPLTGTTVGTGALTTNGQTVPVPHAAVAADIHQTLDVQLRLRTERTFHLFISLMIDRSLLSWSSFHLTPCVEVDTGFLRIRCAEV